MTVTGRLDEFQRRHPLAEFPLAVIYKYGDDTGLYLAALIAYYGLVSLFPLLLLLSTVLGWVLAGCRATAGPTRSKTVLSTVGGSGAGSLGTGLRVVVLAASVALNAAVFVFVFRYSTARLVSVRDVAPGAVAAAVVWQLLQSFGVIYVEHVVKNASDTNGVFALVLGLLAFLYLTADRRAYATQGEAQQMKGFQDVEVRFRQPRPKR